MLLYGTGANLAALFAALLLFASEAPRALAVTAYFSPLPYNLFLCVAVCRSAKRAHEPYRSAVRLAAVVWFLIAVVV